MINDNKVSTVTCSIKVKYDKRSEYMISGFAAAKGVYDIRSAC